MKRSFVLSFLTSILFIGFALLVFPDIYISHYWLILRSAYLLSLFFIYCALFIVVRSFRLLLVYLFEIPRSANRFHKRVYIYWLMLFFGWFLVILSLFPYHTCVITGVLAAKEFVTWWQKRKRSFTFE